MAKKIYTQVKRLSALDKIGISKESEYFMENLAMLFSTGMDINYALDSVKAGLRTPQMKRLVEDIQREIREGSPLWKVLEKTDLLKPSALSLIKIGEETGKLPENLKIVVEQIQKDEVFNSRIRSGMMYPTIVMVIAVGMSLGISKFLLPNLAKVFMSLNMKLPPLTVAILSFGTFVEKNGAWFIPTVLITIGLTFYIVFLNSKTKVIGQYLLYHTPVIRTLIQEVEIARFGHVFGTLVGSGTPIMQALDSLTDSTSYYNFKKFYTYLKFQIEIGTDFEQIFKSYKGMNNIFPINVQYLLIAAKKAGQLQSTLEKISRIYEEKVDNTTKNLSVLLEPLMLIFVWAGVLGIAIGVLQPIYGLIGNFDINQSSAPPPKYIELIGKNLAKIGRGQVFTLDINNKQSTPAFSEPSASGSVYFEVLDGHYYDIYDKKNDWYLVEAMGPTGKPQRGWIESKYIKVTETYATATTIPTKSN